MTRAIFCLDSRHYSECESFMIDSRTIKGRNMVQNGNQVPLCLIIHVDALGT
jgi:hypothetical protein